MKSRVLKMMLASGLVLGLFAGAIGAAGAFHEGSQGYNPGGHYVADCNPGDNSGEAHQVFPWVPNGTDDMDGMGPFYGSITIQNLYPDPVDVDLFVGTGVPDENWDYAGTLKLSGNESQTQSASDLGIPSGEGASVIAIGFEDDDRPEFAEDDDDDTCDNDGDYEEIAGVAKNVNPVPGLNAKTTTAHSIVDGYSALNGNQISDTDNSTYILPIVQSNGGWDTEVRVANFDEDGNTAQNVTVDLFPADNQGYGGPAEQVQLNIPAGDVESFTISDVMGDGWVGSAFIQSGSLVGAVAERFKADDDMLVTNTSRPEFEGDDLHYAALVFKGYNFWNTGIAIANLSENDNHVTISYYGPTNNVVGTESLTIPPRAMEFVHTPGWQDLGFGPQGGFVGSAIIESTNDENLMAAVDQIKYMGDDPDVGQAMSYVTNGDNFDNASGDVLAMPLIQKGSTLQGTGDTSGVQLFNPQDDDDTDLDIQFFTANGNPAAPTVNPDGTARPMEVSLAAYGSYTLYTHAYSEMPGNFQGSLMVDVDGDELVGVSNNVNYAVDGDGSVAFPMVYSEDGDLTER